MIPLLDEVLAQSDSIWSPLSWSDPPGISPSDRSLLLVCWYSQSLLLFMRSLEVAWEHESLTLESSSGLIGSGRLERASARLTRWIFADAIYWPWLFTVLLRYHYQKLKGRAKPRLPSGSPTYVHWLCQVSKSFIQPFLRNCNLNLCSKISK